MLLTGVYKARTTIVARAFVGSLFSFMLANTAFAQSVAQFTVVGVVDAPNNQTIIFEDGNGNEIKITHPPSPINCFAAHPDGTLLLYASESWCDQTVEMQIQTNGFLIDQISFLNIGYFDGNDHRDAIAAGVAGNWSNLDGLIVHDFANPPSYADEAGRLEAAGGVGTFLTGIDGVVNQESNGPATFQLATPTDSFTIYFDDVEGARQSLGTFDFSIDGIELIISGPEANPEATNDISTGNVAGSSAVVSVLANDIANDSPIDPTSVVLTSAPAGSTLAPDGQTLTVPGEGVWTVNPTTGDITFTPETGFAGDPTPVEYTVSDTNGGVSNPGTITIGYDYSPTALDDIITSETIAPVTINPLSNDSDADGTLDPTSVVLTSAPAGSTLAPDGQTLTVPGEGVWTVNPTTGDITFTPETGFAGSPTPVTYTVEDNSGNISNEAVLSVTFNVASEIIANSDGPITLNGPGGGTSQTVLANDTLGGVPITDPSMVTLTPVSLPTPADGSITLNPNGTISVAPGTTPGTYTLVYQICETADPTNCATAQVELVVAGGTTTGLISDIEDDLVFILEEDLANTLTTQSSQISGYSASALDQLRSRSHDGCLAGVNARANNILFDTNKATIKAKNRSTLDEIASILSSCSGVAFEIAGHTDSDGSNAYNLDLSKRRAAAVMRALAERGVNTTGSVVRGYGESQPIASNATQAGKLQNRRVEFRALESDGQYSGPCDNSFSLVRGLSAQANNDGVAANGQFARDDYDCITDRREIFEGSFSYSDTETGQTQSAINLSYRREQYRGSDSVFGYFVGLYGSQSDVTRRADGEIRGLGLNAGIYGAKRLQNEMFIDYYVGAAAGRHEFDLTFDPGLNAISANGDYRYVAGFAGVALSGEMQVGEATLTPRIGFDYLYTPGADVDVIAEMGGLSEVGGLELDAISGGRAFAEIRSEHRIQDGQATLSLNPRVSCYQSVGALDGVCGFGGSIGIESVEQDNGLTYAFEVDGEWGDGYSLGSVTMSFEREVGIGVLSGDADVRSDGTMSVGGAFEVRF